MIREQADREKLSAKYAELLTDLLKFVKIDNGNYKPDIYTIGPRHVAHAAENHSGMLGPATTEAIGCSRCGLPMSKHVFDTVLFVEVTRECTEDDVKKILTPEFGKMLEEDELDGVAFLKGYELIKRPVKA